MGELGPVTGESPLTAQRFPSSPFPSAAWERLGSGCHPLSQPSASWALSHENQELLLLVVFERKSVSTVASLEQENDAEINLYQPGLSRSQILL